MKTRTVLRAGLLITLAMAACSGPPNSASPSGQDHLPAASASLHWATVEMPRGSYCWKSGGHSDCAVSPGPSQLLATGYLQVYRTAGGFDVKVTFRNASQPDGLKVRLVQSPDGRVVWLTESAPQTFSVAISPPAAAGLYVYEVTATWPEGDVSFFLALQIVPGVA